MKKQKIPMATDCLLNYFQICYEDGSVYHYMETKKHYFYRYANDKLKRISGEEFESARAEYYNY